MIKNNDDERSYESLCQYESLQQDNYVVNFSLYLESEWNITRVGERSVDSVWETLTQSTSIGMCGI